jgi:hypothetical protein
MSYSCECVGCDDTAKPHRILLRTHFVERHEITVLIAADKDCPYCNGSGYVDEPGRVHRFNNALSRALYDFMSDEFDPKERERLKLRASKLVIEFMKQEGLST